MRIKILVVGNTGADAAMLREKRFLIYNCKSDNLDSMVDEVKPDLIFINTEHPQDNSNTKIYNELLDNVRFASYPVIYTLSEDDVYLVSRKRTAQKEKRTVITDNIVDGIKAALLPTVPKKTTHAAVSKNIPFSHYAHRA